ncbi:MAG: translation initiation factor [Muribaculaceae bacterium]
MENNDWKNKLSSLYPSLPAGEELAHENNIADNNATKASTKQNLRIMLDKSNRKGKSVTLIINFEGSEESLKDLAKELKTQCGAGGSARGGEILIQGDVRNKVKEILCSKGYKAIII